MTSEVEQYKRLVRSCLDDIKKLDNKLDMTTFNPPMQKLRVINLQLLMLPKSISEEVADVMAQQGAAELLAEVLTSTSDKDSPAPELYLTLIETTVSVLMSYTDKSPAFGLALGQCGIVKYLLDIMKHQPLWERSKTNSIARTLMVVTICLLANLCRVPQNRTCFRQTNAVPVMQELLRNDRANIRISSLNVIALVLEDSDLDPLGETDTINELLKTIGRPNMFGRYKRVDEVIYLAEELLEALAMLSVCWPVRRKIYEAGAVVPLVQSLREGRAREKLHAVMTLNRLSRDPGTCSQMRQEGQLHCPIWSTNQNQLRETGTGSWASAVFRIVKGFISCCSSSRANEVQARLAGVPKWNEGDVQAWLEESGLAAYGRNFTEVDGSILHCLLEIRQQAPEFFAMVARDVGGFHCLEDFLKFLDAVEKLG
ncbi:uncharacterized protein LOC144733851 isoform X1 [Lampetra planeri]